MRKYAQNESAQLKKEIQQLLRAIVIRRDGTCILRRIRYCTDGVLQADHLITRANSATFADSRLVVCLCRSCHGGFKQWHKPEYDALVKTVLPKERSDLWERAERDSWRPKRMGPYDWKLAIIALQQELKSYP